MADPITSMLPTVEVACPNPACPSGGKTAQARLRPATFGFVDVPQLMCTACGHTARIVRPWKPAGAADAVAPITAAAKPVKAAGRGGRPRKAVA